MAHVRHHSLSALPHVQPRPVRTARRRRQMRPMSQTTFRRTPIDLDRPISIAMPAPPICRSWSISGPPGADPAAPWRRCSKAAAKEFEPRLRFAKVDTDAERKLAARYHIQAIPTMMLIRGGREVARHSGAMPTGALRAWIERHLAA